MGRVCGAGVCVWGGVKKYIEGFGEDTCRKETTRKTWKWMGDSIRTVLKEIVLDIVDRVLVAQNTEK